ncbi:MAG: CDP-diacylglycerol--glycerol-3-phosphate 3-phosphatidyltransferase [Candidatus Aquicultor secundus]|uniref:CDP-diacylglycerol--glycerol-3-phosphate 3-phosphatidyltransferase n=1 Tax=Candidatus Aquicultor secundus TaxID=1973895 RepID=A0A2M7T915_9ACTN|nr:MAG: CDP-diacylglycerol--glycerol-3-phosphate 3-phosphatidyltransferase [Candidatus Aquicultor secundus]PIW23186.1 MAG: CDP-diacylglycerol--glycerol-3-phosphate 3-phosphatidyltransferase [Candidatus Aquicultor secundus]PIX52073.1 MAG: CDP-diacylglycerol--glycerol-3-phosphate 3-phosphatidyltransferase [Candidatus Aquicultor secundus]PIY39378.1 MAG: CDP-diacylglycerol--glycerol-3-phosphate 3-phosphatidyltransferase [Candidatus Aquicultor secundus]PIZ40606.1 MAG: CDP-diacylglycerol--glycerol-3-
MILRRKQKNNRKGAQVTLNIPNLLTLSRLLLVPVYVYAALAASSMLNLVAALAFGIAALTDLFDGFVARRLNQVTDFGKILDPVVDRILIISAMVVLYVKISALVPLWVVLTVVGRDLLMILGWVYISHLGIRIKVAYEGKVATAILMFSVFFLLLDVSVGVFSTTTLGIGLFYIGVALSLVTGLKYVKLGISIIKSKQAHK